MKHPLSEERRAGPVLAGPISFWMKSVATTPSATVEANLVTAVKGVENVDLPCYIDTLESLESQEGSL